MIHGYKQPVFQGVSEKAFHIRTPSLQFDVIALPIHAGMHFRAARHGARNFLAQKEIGIAPQLFDRIDRIVIGDGNQVHAALFQPCAQRERFIKGFGADSSQPRHSAKTGMHGVDVEVAPHAFVLSCRQLQNGDFATKQL
jgi:hypothetical protein